MVVLVGRRRRASYATIAVLDAPSKQASSSKSKSTKLHCVVPENLAKNLRLRQDDAVKVVPLGKGGGGATDDAEDDDPTAPSERSGDLVLLDSSKVPVVTSVTLSPLTDSLEALQASEGGEFSDEELQDRFVKLYTEGATKALFKRGHILTLLDENGRHLDFVVSHVELEGEDSGKPTENGEEGTCDTYFFIPLYSCGIVLGGRYSL